MRTDLPALVLAAGESRRMGRLKSLLPLGSRTVLQRVVDGLADTGAAPILVVLGHRAEEVGKCLADRRVTLIVNERYPQGMLSSIQWGARNLPPEAPAFLLCLGDHPDIRPEVIRALTEAWNARPGCIVVPTVGGRRGHPILIDARHLPALLALREPQTLRDLVHAPETVRIEVPVESDGPLLDLDTPEEYEAALRSGRFMD